MKRTLPAGTSASTFAPDQPARLVALVLALLTVLVYLPAGGHDFIAFDDPSYVTDNAMVQNGLTWAGFQWAFLGWHASNWHPLTWLSHQLDCELFGLNAGAQHLVNVLFHAANTVLLLQLWRRLSGALWPSALVAALFAWHPLHVESVAWVSERKDVLSTFFGLLAMLAYARHVKASQVPGAPVKIHFGWSLGAFALALLAKPMLVTLPCVLLLLDYWPLQRFTDPWRERTAVARLIREKWPFFLLSILSSVCTWLAQRHSAMASWHQYPFGFRAENALVAVAAYLGKLAWPANLSVYYPLPREYAVGEVVRAVVVVTGISLLAWHWRGRHRYLLTGWLWFLGMLAPVIGLVQVGSQAMADRYTYLPAAGLFVAAAFGLAEARARGLLPAAPLLVAVSLLLGGCVVVTEHQLSYWRDSETLFNHALAVTPRNGMAHMLLGVTREQAGQLDGARQEYALALAEDDALSVQVAGGEKRPLAAQARLLAAQVAEQNHQVAAAMADYRAALALDHDIVEAHSNLGNLLAANGQAEAALAEYQAALRLRPELPLLHENLGTQLADMGGIDAAMKEYQTAARLAPADPRPEYLMGKAGLRRGDSAAAVTAFEAALQLDPNDCPSLVSLARVLATDENQQVRNGSRAVALAEQASQLTGGNQPEVLGTLAMAYAEAGRFDQACQTVQTALTLATTQSPEMIPRLQAQQKLYLANQPCRTPASPAK